MKTFLVEINKGKRTITLKAKNIFNVIEILKSQGENPDEIDSILIYGL